VFTVVKQLDSINQAVMLVRSSLAPHGELVGVLTGGAAVYSYIDGAAKTVIVRPAGRRPDGVHPLPRYRPDFAGPVPSNNKSK
jgi:hypothetical protein